MTPVTLHTHEWPPAPSPGETDTPPVAVLVHGVTGWHRTWWRVGPALAERGWRVVAVDQRGHGRSPRIDGQVGVAEWASDLAAGIEQIRVPVDALIGHSLGAAVSAQAAYRRPELMRRLVLEDPPAVRRDTDHEWLANLQNELGAARRDFDGEVARTREANPHWLEEDCRQDVEGKQLADIEGIVASFQQPTGARVPELVPLLKVPTLYLLGDDERSVYQGDARRRLPADLPEHSSLQVFDAGHVIHRDRFDEYVAAVVEWIEPAS